LDKVKEDLKKADKKAADKKADKAAGTYVNVKKSPVARKTKVSFAV
jgi:hypothetical protein